MANRRGRRQESNLNFFFDGMREIFAEVNALLNIDDNITLDQVERVVGGLEETTRTLRVVSSRFLQSNDQRIREDMQVLLTNACTLLAFFLDLKTSYSRANQKTSFTCPTTSTVSSSGRPAYVVNSQQIECLREKRFSWTQALPLFLVYLLVHYDEGGNNLVYPMEFGHQSVTMSLLQ